MLVEVFIPRKNTLSEVKHVWSYKKGCKFVNFDNVSQDLVCKKFNHWKRVFSRNKTFHQGSGAHLNKTIFIKVENNHELFHLVAKLPFWRRCLINAPWQLNLNKTCKYDSKSNKHNLTYFKLQHDTQFLFSLKKENSLSLLLYDSLKRKEKK